MQWHDIGKADSPQLDELAATYGLHPLHVADCRNKGQRTKVDDGGTYLFIILMLPVPKEDALFSIVTLALFVGADFVSGGMKRRCPCWRSQDDATLASVPTRSSTECWRE